VPARTQWRKVSWASAQSRPSSAASQCSDARLMAPSEASTANTERRAGATRSCPVAQGGPASEDEDEVADVDVDELLMNVDTKKVYMRSALELDDDFGKLLDAQPADHAIAIKFDVGSLASQSSVEDDEERTSYRAMVLEDHEHKQQMEQEHKQQLATQSPAGEGLGRGEIDRTIGRVRSKLNALTRREGDFLSADMGAGGWRTQRQNLLK